MLAQFPQPRCLEKSGNVKVHVLIVIITPGPGWCVLHDLSQLEASWSLCQMDTLCVLQVVDGWVGE